MKLHLLTIGLLASTALPGVVLAQTAAPGTEANKPATAQTNAQKPRRAKPAPKPAAAQAAPVVATAASARDARAQAGMTASPSDFGRVDIKEGGEGVTPGGVTLKDLCGGYMIEV
jgi:hypothetical protein